MNSVMGINATIQNVNFGNKMTKAQQEVLNAIEKSQEKFALEKMRKERPEEYKIVMQNRFIAQINKSIAEMLSPKNIIKTELRSRFEESKYKLAIGLGKFLGKCDRTFNKIPFIKNARERKFAKYEEYINQRFKEGAIDADQAGEMLTKANPKIKKV